MKRVKRTKNTVAAEAKQTSGSPYRPYKEWYPSSDPNNVRNRKAKDGKRKLSGFCSLCGKTIPHGLYYTVRYCSEACRLEVSRKRGRELWRKKAKAIPKPKRYCKRCIVRLPKNANPHRKLCEKCVIELNRIRARAFRLTAKGKEYERQATRKRRERYPERIREIQRRSERKIAEEQKKGLRPKKKTRHSPLNNAKSAWKKELLKWPLELREARLQLGRVRQQLGIGQPRKSPEVWQSLIEALKREAILPT